MESSSLPLKGLEQLHWQAEAIRMKSFDSIATFSKKRVKCKGNKKGASLLLLHVFILNIFFSFKDGILYF